MKMNEVIRKLRKEQNLTQEQVAVYLGVSAPAVNKWENGISYPDIMLLAPLARVLKTNIDTLLSFHEELTELEINQIIAELSKKIGENGFDATFKEAEEKIKEYPNCNKLMLYASQILYGYLMMGVEDVKNKDSYLKQILAWLKAVAFCEDQELANMAIVSLSQNYIKDGKFDDAQKLLDQIPPVGFDKRMMQASLYSHQGDFLKAMEVQEKMLYENANRLIHSLMQLIGLFCKQENYDRAIQYTKLSGIVAQSFELGDYIEASSRLTVYVAMKNEEESVRALQDMVQAFDTINAAKDSNLYEHMTFREEDGVKDMTMMMKKWLVNDEDMSFLKDNKEYQKIISGL